MIDIRLAEIKNRKGMAFGVKEMIGTLVGGGILLMIGLFTYQKVGTAADLLNGGTYVNTTDYCSAAGTWNGTNCNGGTLVALPSEYSTMTSVKGNILSGFDLGSVVFIIIAAAVIIGVIWLAFR